jgi:signal transduction histidine kinase/CheY-like chemotaxis protein
MFGGRSTESTARDLEAFSSEALLASWREQVLRGVLGTSALALVPAIGIATWQSQHGQPGVRSGIVLAASALVALVALSLWKGAYTLRVGLLITIAYVFSTAAMFSEGLAPAQFVSLGTVVTLCVLLISTRAALLMLGACLLSMAAAAYGFASGLLHPHSVGHVDPRVPLNWLRIGLYTLFPTATAAVATSYVLGKLNETLHARTELVARLRSEIEQRQRAHAELERAQKLEAIGQLAAGIAHDFNNTLSVVSLEAELLKRKTREPAAIARAAEALLGAAERGAQLVRQLLLFGRADTQETEVVDAARTVELCTRALQRLLPPEIRLEMGVHAGVLAVCMNPSELQQIVLNLGINARDAMPRGGTLRFDLTQIALDETSAREHGIAAGRYALLTCCDTGTGMDEHTLARVFEPFFTTKSRAAGTGLGLTNVWNIARRTSGTAQATSTPGVGTTFRIYLPLSSEVPKPAPRTRLNVGGGHETVLVVEDDISIRALLVSTLIDAGYAVLDAGSADAALPLLRQPQRRIDLLCTDVAMPGMSARELIGELRAQHPEAAVLVCSGYSEDERIARGIREGEWRLLPKPFDRQTLLSAVRDALPSRPSEPPRAQEPA